MTQKSGEDACSCNVKNNPPVTPQSLHLLRHLLLISVVEAELGGCNRFLRIFWTPQWQLITSMTWRPITSVTEHMGWKAFLFLLIEAITTRWRQIAATPQNQRYTARRIISNYFIILQTFDRWVFGTRTVPIVVEHERCKSAKIHSNYLTKTAVNV